MRKRLEIRYGKFWVRLVCCIWVGVVVANLVYFDLLADWEQLAREVVQEISGRTVTGLPFLREVLIVFVVSILIAVFRIERPLAMVAYGVVVAGLYIVAVFAAAFHEVGLPVVSALLGLVGATAVMETMAWTEERSKRRTLEQLEVAKQQFTDMLVHDLRRRISSMLMSFSLLEKKSDIENRERGLVNTIKVTGERVLTEISDLLDIRKIEEGKMSLKRCDLPLGDVLNEVLSENRAVEELMSVKVLVIHKDDQAIVSIDRAIFSRVISNLLWNAVKHAPEASDIEIRLYRDDRGDIVLSMANHGEPIPKDRQELMFDAFVSGQELSPRKLVATGLGLAFCKLAVEAHGGSLELKSPWPEDDGVLIEIHLRPSV